MTEALIVNGVIIANGVEDSDGDILDKKDIKTIFMKYQRDTDTMHTNIKNHGVEVFASWISEVDTLVDGKLAPAGSWLATLKVTNEKLIECINQGKLKGFSLGSVSDKAFTPQYWFINKSLNYRDMKSIEEVIPLFISFVDRSANQYTFEVMSYDAYINKNEKDVENMTEVETKEEKISLSTFERIIDLFGVNKSEEDEEPEIEKEETSETTESADETITALFDKLDTIIEQNNQILEGLNKAEVPVDEEEEIEKAEEDEKEPSEEEEVKPEEDTSADDEEEVKVEKSEEEISEEEDDEEDDDDVHVDKRETNMIENQNIQNKTTFYQNTGRDSLGRKIRR